MEKLLAALVEGPLSQGGWEGLRAGLDAVRPVDVVRAVDAIVAGLPQDEGGLEGLKPAVARLLNLVHRPLEAAAQAFADPFFALLVAENREALQRLEACRAPLASLLGAEAAGGAADALRALAEALALLDPIGLHYVRLENVAFPLFEARFPEYRCLSLMWSIHDDVRASLSALKSLCASGRVESKEIALLAGRLFFDLNGLVFREERILYPVLAPLVAAGERAGLYREALALGPGLLGEGDLALLEVREEAWSAALATDQAGRAGEAGAREAAQGTSPAGWAGPAMGSPDAGDRAAAFPLDTGALSPTALEAIFGTLHLDLSFIDADDRLAWFSNGPARVFPRSASAIGRDVRNCHPPESLGRVMGLIGDFRAGRREHEAFWIDMGGRFIHIEYFALRGPDGAYLGVLEASEDLTGKRALAGEKRLASPG